MQLAQVLAELLQVALAGLYLGQQRRFQQVAHLFVEVVAELAQPELTFAAGRFQLLPLGGLRQAVASAQQLGRAAEEAAVGEDLAQGGVGFDEAPVLRVVAGT